MTEQEIKTLRNQYNREWRAKNKDKVQQYNKRYWERRAEKMQEQEKKERAE